MHYSLFLGAALAASVSTVSAEAGCTNDGGNWYCEAVDLIKYQGFANDGTYREVTGMDPNSLTCSSRDHAFSGAFGPLGEEVSFDPVEREGR